MRQTMNQQSQRVAGPFGPLSLFYVSAVLGLLLAAWNGSYAEPMTGAVDSKPVEKSLSASPSDPLIIPGTQSAVLTVSKEIQTSAPIVNSSQKPSAIKKASKALSGNATAVSSGTRPKEGYYLELPAPSTAPKRPQSGNDSAASEPLVTPAGTVPVANAPSLLLQPESATPADAQTSNLMGFTDPESVPLDFSASSSALPAAATDALIRVTLGLVAVLSLLLVFSRKVLPQLMVRYPAFFENLKRTSQSRQSEQGGVSFSVEEPLERPLDIPQFQMPPRTGQQSIWKRNFLAKAFRPFENKAEGTMLTLQGKQFNVLSSTALGKDKDLHLVEIMGRQLVIASTPYTVSLIQELSPAEKSAPEKPAQANSAYDLGVLLEPDYTPSVIAPVVSREVAEDAVEAPLLEIGEEWGTQPLFSLDESGMQDVVATDLPTDLSEDRLSSVSEVSVSEELPVSEAESDWLLDGSSEAELSKTGPDAFACSLNNSSPDASGLNHAGLNNSELDDSEDPPFIRHYKSNNFATRPQSFRPLTDAELGYQRYLDILVPKSERNASDVKATERTVAAEETSALSSAHLDSVFLLKDYDDVYGD